MYQQAKMLFVTCRVQNATKLHAPRAYPCMFWMVRRVQSVRLESIATERARVNEIRFVTTTQARTLGLNPIVGRVPTSIWAAVIDDRGRSFSNPIEVSFSMLAELVALTSHVNSRS